MKYTATVKSHVWFFISVILLVCLIFSIMQNLRTKGILSVKPIDTLYVEYKYPYNKNFIDSIIGDNKKLKQSLTELQLNMESYPMTPDTFLGKELAKHNGLIPYKGVLGGIMGFYYPDEIYRLPNNWVLASFDDGHIGGYMLLKYSASEIGKAKWKVLDSGISK